MYATIFKFHLFLVEITFTRHCSKLMPVQIYREPAVTEHHAEKIHIVKGIK